MSFLDIIADEETKKRLEAYAPITPSPDWWYTPRALRDADIPEDKKPRFKLREIKTADMYRIIGKTFDGTSDNSNAISRVPLLVEYGLIAWENFGEFNAKSKLDSLSATLMSELANAITIGSTLQDDEVRSLK